MASRLRKDEYGISDKVLQTVPDWSAAEVTTGVSFSSVCLVILITLFVL